MELARQQRRGGSTARDSEAGVDRSEEVEKESWLLFHFCFLIQGKKHKKQ